MLKKTMTYTDYDGESRTEDFYFNLNKAECLRMQSEVNGGLDKFLKKIVNENNQKQIMAYMEEFVLMSHGEKTVDGRFIKNEEIRARFMSTEAYSDLIMELATNAKAASEFINGVMPADLMKQVQANQALPAKND